MAPNPIQALLDEVEIQPGVLGEFARRRFPKAMRGSVFVGAGDSYAAAVGGFYASRGRCVAVDPYVFAATPEIADGEEVYFVSVSGRTASNILAASKAKGHAKRTYAVTAVSKSQLAGLTDAVIKLPLSYAPRTPGILSFSLSLLAVLKIAGAGESGDFAGALRRARDAGIGFSEGGTTYFLGNGLAHSAAIYGAAKTYEILGAKAHAELLEEFSHLELFSLMNSDFVNCFACFDPSGLAGRLNRALRSKGYASGVVPDWRSSSVEELFYAVFLVQLSVLKEAKRRGLAAPSFLTSRGVLDASDEMIY